jgi:outer membrane protein TolC
MAQPVPLELSPQNRPDLAAQAASLRTRGAGVDRARGEFYPSVDLRAMYGEQIWSFEFQGPPSRNRR